MYVDTVYGFYGYFLCLVGCFSMITWTPTVLSVLYVCVSYFCICTCSAQMSMFHMERRSRNTLTIIIIIIFPNRAVTRSSQICNLNIGTLVATLPGAWRYRVNSRTGGPGVSTL